MASYWQEQRKGRFGNDYLGIKHAVMISENIMEGEDFIFLYAFIAKRNQCFS